MATVNPYDAFKQMYQQRTDAINAQTKQAELERTQREQAAQKTLESANRGVYTTYKNAINPYGRMASQNNFSQGVSDYYNNASYGTMLQGLGSNQYNYNDAMNNSNSLWQNYLSQKAGQEADALGDYNNAVLAQQKYDKEQKIAEQERQEAIRQFNLKLEMQKAQEAEEKRRYDQEWAYKLQQDKLAQEMAAKSYSSGGSSGGGSSRSSSTPSASPTSDTSLRDYVSSLYDTEPKRIIQERYTSMGAMDPRNSGYKNSSTYVVKTVNRGPSSSKPGYDLVEKTYADGTKKTEYVKNNSKVRGKATVKANGKMIGGVKFGTSTKKK